MSAVCVYSLADITKVFATGGFRDMKRNCVNSGSSESVPDPRPGQVFTRLTWVVFIRACNGKHFKNVLQRIAKVSASFENECFFVIGRIQVVIFHLRVSII